MNQQEARDIWDYEPSTGFFRWKFSFGRRIKKGARAGGSNREHYRIIYYKNVKYKEHNLAWLYVYGNWPNKFLDHINGIKDDNRIENLRETDDRLNALNKKEHRNGTLPGTRYNYKYGRWEARIMYKGKKVHLGSYSTKEEASNRYLDAVDKAEKLDNEMLVKFLNWVSPNPIGRPKNNPHS
jgi:hypothetical protein